MTIKSFEEILSWQRGRDLAVRIYATFAGLRDFEFGNQIRRAVVSISNNISEGFERGSDPDFVRMLYIAKGSAGEVRSMVYLAHRLAYIDDEQKLDLLQRCNEISKLIAALIKSIHNRTQTRGVRALEMRTND